MVFSRRGGRQCGPTHDAIQAPGDNSTMANAAADPEVLIASATAVKKRIASQVALEAGLTDFAPDSYRSSWVRPAAPLSTQPSRGGMVGWHAWCGVEDLLAAAIRVHGVGRGAARRLLRLDRAE